MSVAQLTPSPAALTGGVVQVVIVDRHRMFARGLQAVLTEVSNGRVSVVAHEDVAAKLPDLIRRHRPQVVVLDLDLDGALAAVTDARRRHPGVRIAGMVGEAAATEKAVEAFAAGAHGVLVRDAEPETFAAHLLAVATGGAVAPPEALASLLRRRPADALLSQLRGVDVELWRLVAEGHETVVIARRLCVSERTAKRMVARLLQRLGVSSRVQAAALAGRCGLLDLEHP